MILFLLFILLVGHFSSVFAQESITCEQRLEVVREELTILQDQHAMITIPRAEADQRMLISLRRQLEKVQQSVRELEDSLQKQSKVLGEKTS